MTPRLDLYTAAPPLLNAYLALSRLADTTGLEKLLLELVKIRASQLNACANCLNMHTSDAKKLGETDQRLHLLTAWAEAPCYSSRERAALAWTDHLTLVAEKRAPEAIYATLDSEFTHEEQVQLTLAIIVINGWNRLAIGFNLFSPELGWPV